MSKYFYAAALAAFLSAAAPAAQASTVLSFDDIGAGGAVPVNYGGLDWSAAGWSYYAGENAPYTPHSGDYRAALGWYDDSEAAAGQASSAVRFTAPAVFEGAWFAGLQGATVSFDLYLGGAKVWSSATLDPNATATFLASGYAGLVDQVVLRGPALYAATMDDFTFTAAVPEPSEYALLAAGLGVVSLVVRRRRQR
ncbi:PEP-CTERM sorting domain-containing protein [Pelomonas sp. KK5]|uniref:PEP-CTERM sorting domain-containing protein n=1 Tax=Pelomonas sp. KK5 TaxID=1855730 RepID=UPI00097C65D2|nr:PEP-CTERM sorting domain-containing protein [Pelomonas sp. KK5]